MNASTPTPRAPTPRSTTAVRVVVVEDSLVYRTVLVRTLVAERDIVVVGEATGASEAVEMVARLRPDVVTLDLHIPDGGGHHAIEQIMAYTPTPILVLSSTVTGRQSAPAVEALVAGAIEAMPKPGQWTPGDAEALRSTVRALRGVTVLRHPRGRRNDEVVPSTRERPSAAALPSRRIVAIAASTGGPPALALVLSGLVGLRAPVLVVQHIHADFVDGLMTWMERVSGLPVKLAEAGAMLQPGTVYVGRGGAHLRLGPGRRIVLDQGRPSIHCPSADELFASLAEHAGPEGIGVVLTGMGDDGASGLLALRQAGGTTIAQDEASSAVFGMARAASRLGAVMDTVPLDQVAATVMRACAGTNT